MAKNVISESSDYETSDEEDRNCAQEIVNRADAVRHELYPKKF